MKKLKWIRILLAWAAITWVTFAFLGLARTFPAKQQLFPAILAGNLMAFGIILVLTLLFGRFYCSVICPLGILQDGITHLSELRKKSKGIFQFRKESRLLRYGILAVFGAALVLGAGVLPMLLEPYSNYGLMVSQLLLPLYQHGVNFAADVVPSDILIAKFDMTPIAQNALLFAAVYLAAIFAAAWFGGRIYCQTICPVGTLLGTLSRFAIFRTYIDEKTCVHCGMCERICRSSCIDVKSGVVDGSRCVDCMNCIAVCPTGAMSFGRPKSSQNVTETAKEKKVQAPSISRRELLITGAAAVGTAATAMALKTSKIAAVGASEKKVVMPPGAGTRDRFATLCSACHLCVDHCRGGVLRPANLEYGLSGIFQPRLDFTQGFCDYNCSQCGKVCPTGAIEKLPLKKKRTTVIGTAVYQHFNCLVMKEGLACGNCAAHCPTKAVTMTGDFGGKKLPKVNKDLCIGCGACEYHCPAKPKAIVVIGLNKQQRLVAKESKGEKENS